MSAIARLYATEVQKGRRALEDVPALFREDVRKILEEAE
ncbi:CD1375 family protein [Listeria fleischmannii]|nr:CD1375 family protein [Listeria fleischmannii]